MSAAVKSLGVLAATVHIPGPVERIPTVLLAGTEVTDPAVVEQITNPKCWRTPPNSAAAAGKAPRKPKTVRAQRGGEPRLPTTPRPLEAPPWP